MSVEVFEFFSQKCTKKRIWSEYEHVQESTLDFLGFPERINKYFEMAILQEKWLNWLNMIKIRFTRVFLEI